MTEQETKSTTPTRPMNRFERRRAASVARKKARLAKRAGKT
jgi:hypothetical protein